MVRYRPLPDSALDDFRAYLTHAFNPTGDRYDPEEEDEELPPPMTVAERRGLFDEADLVSVCAHHFFTTRIRGDWHEMGGLSAVATPPEYRRKGYVRTMLAEVLHEYRDREIPFASLWAFSEPFYAKYGWAISNRIVFQEGPPEALAFTRDHASGSFFEAEKSDWESLHDVHMAYGEEFQLTVDRTKEWWQNRLFHNWQGEPYVYGWEDTTGSVEAYVVFNIDETEDGTSQIRIWDMAYASHEAHLNVLRLLANHEAQIDSVRLVGPMDSLLVDILEDPSKLSYTVRAGPMFRLVDVEMALEALSYPESVDTTISIGVDDQLVDWNDSTFDVTINGGTAVVDRGGSTPDVTMDIGALSQLAVGYRPIEQLEFDGDVTIEDDDSRVTLSEIFPEQSVYLRENF